MRVPCARSLELRRRLVEELGVEPGPQTRALYVQVLTDDAEAGQGAIPSRVELRGLVELLRETLARMPASTRVRWTVPSPRWPGRHSACGTTTASVKPQELAVDRWAMARSGHLPERGGQARPVRPH